MEHACIWTHTIPRKKKKKSKLLDHTRTICFAMAHNLTLETSLCNMQKYTEHNKYKSSILSLFDHYLSVLLIRQERYRNI